MKTADQRAEWTKFYRRDLAVGEITALHARFVSHRYPRHSHDHFVVGLVESGAQSYTYRGANHITPAGHMFVVNPDEVHTGEAANSSGYVYRTLCLGEPVVAELTRDLYASAKARYLKGAVFGDPNLARALTSLHTNLADGAPGADLEGLLFEAVALLFDRYGDGRPLVVRKREERAAVAKARKYIEDHFSDELSLSLLGGLTCLSPFYFARSFKDATGLPPHSYIDGVRARKARKMLDSGESIVSTAISVGYADQSHLTKRFKRVYGITPGQYCRAKHA
jgi:AraC-like DNA-binding protein